MVRIGIIGDFQRSNETHTAIAESLHHTGVRCTTEWIPTETVESADLDFFDGLWCAPGSPFRSLDGALAGIRFAREYGGPFLGTCAGFQHAVLEFARNVLSIEGAASAEYDPSASHLFVSRLACSLVGQRMIVELARGSRAHAAYAADKAAEHYYCNFGLNPAFERDLQAGGLCLSGRDAGGEVRVIELPGHPFFVGTLFVPQVSSKPERPHPLIGAFARAAWRHAQHAA